MTTCRPLAAATATAILALTSCSPSHVQTPSPASAGQSTQSDPLEAGQERHGVLSARDSLDDDRRMQSWALRGHRGQQVVVDLISTEFDPVLGVVGPGIHPLMDDDGGGACNARITFTPPEDGIYWLLIQGPGERGGAFTLRASSNALPPAAGECGSATESRFSPEELNDVPVRGALAIGDDVIGELTSQDRQLKDAHARAYELKVSRGASLTIDLTSTAFDAYLAVTGPGLERALEDDDSGGGCDARILLSAPADGVYRVIVTSANEGETGRFTLRARTSAPPARDASCDMTDHPSSTDVSPDELTALPVQGTIRVGDDIAGELTSETPSIVDGTHALVWTIAGTRGKTVIVDLVSSEFDGFLMVVGPGIDPMLSDDDSGGACNPRIALTFPADGTYRLVANTVDRGATGRFHLRVSSEKTPTAPGSCEGHSR